MFEVVSGKDYEVTVIHDGASDQDYTGWQNLSNKDWKSLYSMQYVPGYGDLHLMVDKLSFNPSINMNWTFALENPNNAPGSCKWSLWLINPDAAYKYFISGNFSGNTIKPGAVGTQYRLEYMLGDPANPPFPEYEWPKPLIIRVNEIKAITEVINLCSEKDYLLDAPLHVSYAMAQRIPNASKVQIALPFLIIVVVANIIKIIAIWITLWTCSSGHIITVGDAISSFLQYPEMRSAGKCTFEKSGLIRSSKPLDTEPWFYHKKPIVSLLGGRRLGTTFTLYV